MNISSSSSSSSSSTFTKGSSRNSVIEVGDNKPKNLVPQRRNLIIEVVDVESQDSNSKPQASNSITQASNTKRNFVIEVEEVKPEDERIRLNTSDIDAIEKLNELTSENEERNLQLKHLSDSIIYLQQEILRFERPQENNRPLQGCPMIITALI